MKDTTIDLNSEYKVLPKVKTAREFSKSLKLKSPTLSCFCLPLKIHIEFLWKVRVTRSNLGKEEKISQL